MNRIIGIAALSTILLMAWVPSIQAAKPPNFSLKTIDGEMYSLADDLGKHVIILDFWATWCKPCLRELPHINEINEKYQESGLKVFAISVDDASAKSRIKPTMKRYKFDLPILLDPASEALRKFNPNKNVPFLVVIGIDGEIVRTFSGFKPGDEKIVEELVKAEIAKSAE